MARVLIVTVGGSCEPIINACREYRPDFIYFICSSGAKGSGITVDGPGNPCGDNRYVICPNCSEKIPVGNPRGEAIVSRLGLPTGTYEKVEVEDPDDLTACYSSLQHVDKSITARFGPHTEVIANYTGGTKTMSVALALLAVLKERWELSVNKGPRIDLIKVRGGDIPVLADKLEIILEIYRGQVTQHLRRYAYDAADDALAQVTVKERLSPQQRESVLRLRRLCQAFHAWDLFDHPKALELLRIAGGSSITPYVDVLIELAAENPRTTGFEYVADIFFNASRRAEQGRYDDAVARLYRALEMLAQVRLKSHWGINTSNVDPKKLPVELRDKYEEVREDDGKIRLPLRKAYQLLADLGDGLGRIWQERENCMLSVLNARNSSILAHGTVAFDREMFDRAAHVLENFIQDGLTLLKVKIRSRQLPQAELLDM
ncbi:MAG TPA: TIGR02710 family CRISPR-associated protein [Clostridia bacterium]|nr:TIGR02710 family CRISPR-associated protein [Clostridia bacterium]